MRAQMPTGHFEMAPLDEFTVIERQYPNHKELPRMRVDQWLFLEGKPNRFQQGIVYDYVNDPNGGNGGKMYIKAVKPTDVEVYQDDNWEVVFDLTHFQ